MIGTLSVAVATVAALPLTRVFGDFIGTQAFREALPFRFSVPALLVWTVITLVGAAAAASRRASRLTIRQALTST